MIGELIHLIAGLFAIGRAYGASSLRKRLESNGRISVYGIDSESVPEYEMERIFQPVVQMLVDYPDVKLRLEAFALNGDPASLPLIERRLQMIRMWLIVNEVEAGRLTTLAVGGRAPVDDAIADSDLPYGRIDLVRQ